MIAARFHTPYLHEPRCEDSMKKRGRTALPPIQKNGRQSRAHVPRENAPSGDIPLPTPSTARHSLESGSHCIHEAGNTPRLITPPSRSFPPLSHYPLPLPFPFLLQTYIHPNAPLRVMAETLQPISYSNPDPSSCAALTVPNAARHSLPFDNEISTFPRSFVLLSSFPCLSSERFEVLWIS